MPSIEMKCPDGRANDCHATVEVYLPFELFDDQLESLQNGDSITITEDNLCDNYIGFLGHEDSRQLAEEGQLTLFPEHLKIECCSACRSGENA
ncbi:hypothetical protein [Azomonas macrocytogenes]|uniref:Uncharacterized protein n=1 Tax=Azomonas macrocytogenes TaxID=69962 RepID=A0A839T3M9_AZOMA|nr:hypothetical protein [Azomonas macrocytogenes]MBB3103086.1 hypothetical protein [Azomonas macrocytogenes]